MIGIVVPLVAIGVGGGVDFLREPKLDDPTFMVTKQGTVRIEILLEAQKQKNDRLLKKIELIAERGGVEAQYFLGVMYKDTYFSRRNIHKAIEWLERAAENNHLLAQKELGNLFLYGDGESKVFGETVFHHQDYNKAKKWLSLLANQGDADSQIKIGELYYNGHGVLQNYEEAIRWITKAAEQNNARAQIKLGEIYNDGKGVQKNTAQAIKWHRKAAAGEYRSFEQYKLGRLYIYEGNNEMDKIYGHMWLNIASANAGKAMQFGGNDFIEKVTREREALSKKLSGDQLNQAQEMARKCMESSYNYCD